MFYFNDQIKYYHRFIIKLSEFAKDKNPYSSNKKNFGFTFFGKNIKHFFGSFFKKQKTKTQRTFVDSFVCFFVDRKRREKIQEK